MQKTLAIYQRLLHLLKLFDSMGFISGIPKETYLLLNGNRIKKVLPGRASSS